MGREANFEIVSVDKDKVTLRDLGPWDKHLTITNDVEGVIDRLAETVDIDQKRILYYDSDNELTEVVITSNGIFFKAV